MSGYYLAEGDQHIFKQRTLVQRIVISIRKQSKTNERIHFKMLLHSTENEIATPILTHQQCRNTQKREAKEKKQKKKKKEMKHK